MNNSLNWEIEIISDWDEIYSIEFQKKWQKIVDEAYKPHVFFHPSLCLAWLDTYRTLRNLIPLFCVAKMGDTTLFLPLFLWKQNLKNAFRKIIVPVGFSDFDYHDPLVNTKLTPEELSAFLLAVTEKISSSLSYDEILVNGIHTDPDNNNLFLFEETAPYIDLKEFVDGDQLLASIKNSVRGDLQRQIRRIESTGEISLKEFKSTEEIFYHLDNFKKLHSNRWPDSYIAPNFLENLISRGFDSGIIDFTTLNAGHEIISYNLGFVYFGIYYYYMPVINPDYENFSPGKIHLYYLIKRAIGYKYREFDFLRGNEKYKLDWTDKKRNLYIYKEYKKSVSSELKQFLISVKTRLN